MRHITWVMVALAVISAGDLLAEDAPASGARPPFPAIWRQAKAQDRLNAVRVAELDAKRRLAEQVHGVEVTGRSVVLDLVVKSDRIRSNVGALLRQAVRTDGPVYTEDGIVLVTYGIPMDAIRRALRIGKHAGPVILRADPKTRCVTATGNGALPKSVGLAKIRAKRAAELDAFRKMAEKINGLKLSSISTVKKGVLADDDIATAFSAWLRGTRTTSINYGPDNSCEVTMELRMREISDAINRLLKLAGKKPVKLERGPLPQLLKEKVFTVTGRGAPKGK